MVKTMVEIYEDDRKDLHYIKISTSAKNLPDVLHKAITTLKKHLEEEQKEMKNGEGKAN